VAEVRSERNSLTSIRLGRRVALTDRRFGFGLPGDVAKGERSRSKRNRIVGIQANRFRVCRNRGQQVFSVPHRTGGLGPAQIGIEGGRVARAARFFTQ
jgi:hypothetical protein